MRFGAENLDDTFRVLVDDLEVSYYQHWKLGLSRPWQSPTIDVQPTLAESKLLFDRVHGLLWQAYTVVFHLLNLDRPPPRRIAQNDYRYEFAEDGTTVTRDRVQEAAGMLNDLSHSDVAPVIKTAVHLAFGKVFVWP